MDLYYRFEYNYTMWQTHVMMFFLGLLSFSSPVSATARCSVTNLYEPEGTAVFLKMEYKSTAAANISVVEWLNKELIMRYYPGNKLVVQPIYKGRVQFDNNTFSLELMNLQKKDSGVYRGKIIEKKKGTICAAEYHLSVVEPVAAPTLTVVSKWSSNDSCNVTVTCGVHYFSLTFSCNRSDCTQLQDLPVTPTLAVFARDGHIICNHSNQVSWRNDTLVMSPHCEFAKGEDSTLFCFTWISLTIGLMLFIVAVCVVIGLYAHRKSKQKSTGTSGNYGPIQSQAMS